MQGSPLRRVASLLRRGAGASFAAAACFSSLASAQDAPLPLPTPEPAFFPASLQVQVRWAEIPPTVGRRAAIDTLVFWDSDSSTVPEVIGQYVGDCDFRVSLERVSQDDGFGLHFRILAKLFDSPQAISSPLALDTVDVFESGVAYPIDSAVAPNLSIRFASNVNQPSVPLGSIPVTIGGLNTSIARSSTYVVSALNSIASFPNGSDSLVVRVAGPTTVNDSTVVPVNAQRVDTLVVRSVTDVLPIFNGMTIAFGSGSAAAGDTTQWSARYVFRPGSAVNVSLESFHGYHIWRSDLPDVDDFTLLGEIRVCESKATLAVMNEEEFDEARVDLDYDAVGRTFTFTDRDIHNDFPYRYAVSTFDTRYFGNTQGIVDEGALVSSTKIYPGHLGRNAQQNVYVVPNPYVRSADWQEGEAKVVFTNLPETCTIRVFTEATDHLATLQHGPNESRTTSPTTATWNLKTESGEDLASGVYIYFVEGPGFTQTGKLMVAR